jgi:hypothetical protein
MQPKPQEAADGKESAVWGVVLRQMLIEPAHSLNRDNGALIEP